jgi:hypothetical protein
MAELRFFKCNVLGGFRLSDLNKHVKQNEYFFLDSHIAETSRATYAALRERWMIEVTEKEASQFLSIPKQTSGIQEQNIRRGRSSVSGLAVPNMTEVNKKLESRQAEANFKPVIPNFKEVEEKQKEQRRDTINKLGASTDQELLKGMKDIEKVATPDFSKVGKKEEIKITIEEPKKEEIKVEEKLPTKLVEEEIKLEENIPKELVKETVVVQSDDSITSLVDDKIFDNSLVSTPNFDEKKEEVKKDIAEAVVKQKRVIRKKNKKETIFD